MMRHGLENQEGDAASRQNFPNGGPVDDEEAGERRSAE